MKKKDIILQVGIGNNAKALIAREMGFRVAVLRDARYKKKVSSYHWADAVLSADLLDMRDVKRKLFAWKYRENIAGVVNFYDQYVEQHARVAQLLGAGGPNPAAVIRASDKLQARKALQKGYARVTPDFAIAATIAQSKAVARRIGYPVIIKPTRLDQSKFVTINRNEEELSVNAANALHNIKKEYQRKRVREQPRILIEEYVDGRQYSVDGMVDKNGVVRFTPAVEYLRGMNIGRNEVFAAVQSVPSSLTKNEERALRAVCKKTVRVLGLRHCPVHIEVLRAKDGWKIIEVNPRVGGLRDWLLRRTHGIALDAAYVSLAAGGRPAIASRQRGHAAIVNFFPEQQGTLRGVRGLRTVKKLRSFQEYRDNGFQKGDNIGKASEGFLTPCKLLLFHQSKNILHRDIASALKNIRILVK